MAHSEDQLFMTANLNLVGFALHKNYVTQHNEGARARRHAALGGSAPCGLGLAQARAHGTLAHEWTMKKNCCRSVPLALDGLSHEL